MNPKEEIIPSNILHEINDIKYDTSSGATQLTKQSIHTILQLIELSSAESSDALLNQIKAALHKLVNAQPCMASIFSYANKLLLHLNEKPKTTIEDIEKETKQFSHQFIQNLTTTTKNLYQFIKPILSQKKHIFTFSASSTVKTLLQIAHNKGHTFTVHCSESRPTKEGIILAKNLADYGIQTIISTDAYLFSTISEANLILIGADSITMQGIYHKMGTNALASLASYYHIPLYCVSSQEKIVPAYYQPPMESLKDSSDIIKNEYKQRNLLMVQNYYFDHTPLEHFSGIITQQGNMKPADLKTIISMIPLHETFS